MKTLNSLITIILLFWIAESSAQIRIGGHIQIGVDLPEVVVVTRNPRPQPRPTIYSSDVNWHHTDLGRIDNQNNGPLYSFFVADASLSFTGSNTMVLDFFFDDGNQMTFFLVENNPNDFNYHFNAHWSGDRYQNRILNAELNGRPIRLRNGSVSLQPRQGGVFEAVINLHSRFQGDFNGRVHTILLN